MKLKLYISLIIICLAVGLHSQVNGVLTTVNGKLILKTWGTHTQRGYAQGYLLSEPIMQILNNYFYQSVAMGNPDTYNTVMSFYQAHFTIESKYQQEAQGMVNGLIASGTDITLTGLQRNVTYQDVLMANSLVDLYFYLSQINSNSELQLDCASLSSWGASTQADSLLQGKIVISRFMDWNQDASLIANPLMLISHPSEPDEQDWVSFTYPGMFGALSGISASGKAAFLNTGNVHDYSNLNNLHPILLSIRNGIELYDYNHDCADNITDVFLAVSAGLSLSGTLIHAVSEYPTQKTGIIETNNSQGTVMRTVLNNDETPPGLHLAATNHFRLLDNPVCCTRYSNIVDSLTANPLLTAKRQLSLLAGAAGMENNMMAMQYIPGLGRIMWSTATLTSPAYANEMTTFYLNDLLDFSSPVADETVSPLANQFRVYPNPAHQNEQITIINSIKSSTKLEVYNLKGQKITTISSNKGIYNWNGKTGSGRTAGAGIYLLKLKNSDATDKTAKLLMLP
jgi:hypothetical protein